jgi:hypothetical protein
MTEGWKGWSMFARIGERVGSLEGKHGVGRVVE